MLEQISFVVVSVALLICASRVVAAKNLVHTVLWLGLTLAMTAVIFILLRAPFLAAIQIILYTGGVLTLMLFGVMLTHRDAGFVTVQNPSHRRLSGALLAASVFAMLAAGILRTEPLPDQPGESTIASLGVTFFGEQVLAFEVLSLLLLAAVLGAIVVARRRDAGQEGEERPPIPERVPPRRASEAPRPPAEASGG